MKSFLIKFLVFLLLLGAAFIAFIYYSNYSSGERVGNIIKFSNKGIIIKTWEGQMDLGIFQGAKPSKGEAANTIWDFSVTDPLVVEKIHEANRTGSRVVLQYNEKYMRLFWLGDTKYIVTHAELVAEPKNMPNNSQMDQNNDYQNQNNQYPNNDATQPNQNNAPQGSNQNGYQAPNEKSSQNPSSSERI